MATRETRRSRREGRIAEPKSTRAPAEKDRPLKAARGNGPGRLPGTDGPTAHPKLRGELRRFVVEKPNGWGHDDWLGLLDRLQDRGYDTTDPDAVGRALERERLAAMLAGVPGVGPQRIRSIVERYGTVWDLRQADVDDLTRSAGIPRSLAERIKQAN